MDSRFRVLMGLVLVLLLASCASTSGSRPPLQNITGQRHTTPFPPVPQDLPTLDYPVVVTFDESFNDLDQMLEVGSAFGCGGVFVEIEMNNRERVLNNLEENIQRALNIEETIFDYTGEVIPNKYVLGFSVYDYEIFPRVGVDVAGNLSESYEANIAIDMAVQMSIYLNGRTLGQDLVRSESRIVGKSPYQYVFVRPCEEYAAQGAELSIDDISYDMNERFLQLIRDIDI